MFREQVFRHFSKHLFLVTKSYIERKKAKEEVDLQLEKMRKSIIRMRLSYTDISRLKERIEKLANAEYNYSKFFKPEDKAALELKKQVAALEQQLKNEMEEKLCLISEKDEKIKEMEDSLESMKKEMRNLLIEKAKRHQRLRALEQKISNNVDVHKYYYS